jgi:epoxyqueuosine reductase
MMRTARSPVRRRSQVGGAVVSPDAGEEIVQKALELGATAAGIASLDMLKRSPSHQLLARFGTKIDGEYSYESITDFREIAWPAEAQSVLVIAVAHPRDRPELDWSGASGNTPGNELLMRVGKELAFWSETALGVGARAMTYWVEEGGLYLKDAAVLAGLGCVGRNNILITPERGPRIRLRAVLLDAELAPTGPIEFDPCRGCDERCRTACPQGAFGRAVVSAADAGIDALPGRDGTFSRSRCFVQMGQDFDDSGVAVDDDFLSELDGDGPPAEGPAADRAGADRDSGRQRLVKWCRRCELACPVGD